MGFLSHRRAISTRSSYPIYEGVKLAVGDRIVPTEVKASGAMKTYLSWLICMVPNVNTARECGSVVTAHFPFFELKFRILVFRKFLLEICLQILPAELVGGDRLLSEEGSLLGWRGGDPPYETGGRSSTRSRGMNPRMRHGCGWSPGSVSA